MRSIVNRKEGQSVLELIIALSILVIALVATIVLIVTSIEASREGANKLAATNLAREAIEVARNIRDSNWVDPVEKCRMFSDVCDASNCELARPGGCESTMGLSTWDDGFVPFAIGNTAGVPIIDGVNESTIDFTVTDMNDTDWTRIREDNGRFYQGDASVVGNTQFYRIMTLEPICQNDAGDQEIASLNTFANDCPSAGSGYTEVGMKITAEVRWPEPDSSSHVTIEDHLYNWQVL